MQLQSTNHKKKALELKEQFDKLLPVNKAGRLSTTLQSDKRNPYVFDTDQGELMVMPA